MKTLYGAIEAGGTKFVCAVGSGPDDLCEPVRIATTTPEETLGKVVDLFRQWQRTDPFLAVGIASFGPLDLDPASPTYGYVTSTPKLEWRQTDLRGTIARSLGVPVQIDTDVNVAALGEQRWGAARGVGNVLYLTIGTGIGGGGIMNGGLMHGLVHPEMGHMRLPHDRVRDPFPGACPYHGDCWEGLATGPAIEKRWGTRAENLPPDHPAWPLEAHYLALALANLVVVLSPEKIVLGGGVMEQAQLWPRVHAQVVENLGGYVRSPAILEHIDRYIVPPGLGRRAGVLGAIALAQRDGGRQASNGG